MQIVLVILIGALVAKDTSYLGDPYIMRGAAQGLCLVVGAVWLVINFSTEIVKRYWPIFGYLVSISLSTVTTRDPFYVALQVISLAAVLFFFIAYFETEKKRHYQSNVLITATLLAYTIAAIASLLVAGIWPSIAYETLYGGQVRFRGLFSKSGMMGLASGMAVGLAWFRVTNPLFKVISITAGTACLVLTLSRTFWLALVIAGAMTVWRYRHSSKKWIAAFSTAAIGSGVLMVALGVQTDTRDISKAFRLESIYNLTGRVALWEQAASAFADRPLLGYGFTAGSAALARPESKLFRQSDSALASGRDVGRATLHSGYLQSVLDAGWVGTFFYVSVMIFATIRIFRYGKEKKFAPYFFGLIFLMIANITESVIYSASVFGSILFWALAIFALSLPKRLAP